MQMTSRFLRCGRWVAQSFQRLVSPRWVGVLATILAFATGVLSTGLIASFHFGYVSNPEMIEQADSELIEEAVDLADSVASESDEEEGEAEPDETSRYEIPESLRPEGNHVLSMFNQLGLVELLLPSHGLEQPITIGRDGILDDSDNRISQPFKIPAGLRERVGFWFDVYTKFDSNRRIIHHARHPSIIFKVVDVSMIINSDTPSRLWMRREKADKIVKHEAMKVRIGLRHLALKRKGAKLTEAEQELARALEPLGANVRKEALRALRSVRIQTGQKDFFVEGLQTGSRYLGTMEKIFESHRMPFELTRIPLVESSFNKYATSKVGAAGIWQFMNGTGRKYMMVDGAIDERRSPFKATDAAARLLKENHLILFRSWPLAVTAWNHGPGGVRKAIVKSGSRDLARIVNSYRSRSFDFASSNFYSEFLAALHAERYSEEIFGELLHHPFEDLQAVKLARSVRFNDLLRVSGMRIDDFLAINPELTKAAKQNMRLPRGFRLHVPSWAVENLESLFAYFDARGKGES